MPIILEPKDYEQWLQLNQPKESLLALLANDSAYDDMEAIPVSNFVNNPRHNGAEYWAGVIGITVHRRRCKKGFPYSVIDIVKN